MDTSRTEPSHIRPIAIVAALEREIAPLVRDWKRVERSGVQIFESASAVAAASGIGNRVSCVAEALVEQYLPLLLISAGLAGAAVHDVQEGKAFLASRVVYQKSGQSWPARSGAITLVTSDEIADVEHKRLLAERYGAQAIDMEAAHVAQVAAEYGIGYMAAKAISDGPDFELPGLQQFIRNGRFATAAFATHVAVRPWLWRRAFRLGRNSKRAISALEHLLKQLIREQSQALSAVKSEQGTGSK